jgi:hypothetical protein
MRWGKKGAAKEPSIGDTRERQGFLFSPRRIDGEWRWLENAAWIEEFVREVRPDVVGQMANYAYWRPIKWEEL